MPIKTHISGFGKFPSSTTELEDFEMDYPSGDFIFRGNGMSYGDLSFSDKTLSTRKHNQFIELNTTAGYVKVASGMLLLNLIKILFEKGYTLPVLPGTLYITVGGAIASDVHGKNHVQKGSFGHHIIDFNLITENKEALICSSSQNAELFQHTIGGCGLTGFISEATLKIEPLKGNTIHKKSTPINGLSPAIEALQNSNALYKIVWLKNNRQGALLEGDFTDNKTEKISFKQPFTVPYHFGGILTSKPILSFYNQLKFSTSKFEKETAIYPFLCPLDAVQNWNLLYGPKGIIQFQFTVDQTHIEAAINSVFNWVKISQATVFLATIKQFGTRSSFGSMSFPKEGFTFTIDVKYTTGLEKQLQQLADKIIDQYGGRFYLAKDSFLTFGQLSRSYAGFNAFVDFVRNNKQLKSAFSKRTGIHS
ncbi:MAG: hypothetical protein CL843_10585 [Crocinitomicaceae bacterium]|nr:hypothetical protein [Crocinitomicaceae bacterium]|tara:strand:+ start:971 stop:2233 length:1263 start_codon:yes stop_codon:yes gene_type:complete